MLRAGSPQHGPTPTHTHRLLGDRGVGDDVDARLVTATFRAVTAIPTITSTATVHPAISVEVIAPFSAPRSANRSIRSAAVAAAL